MARGVRDLHSLFWIAKYAYRADGIMDVLAQGVLRDAEAGALHRHGGFYGRCAVICISRWPG